MPTASSVPPPCRTSRSTWTRSSRSRDRESRYRTSRLCSGCLLLTGQEPSRLDELRPAGVSIARQLHQLPEVHPSLSLIAGGLRRPRRAVVPAEAVRLGPVG